MEVSVIFLNDLLQSFSPDVRATIYSVSNWLFWGMFCSIFLVYIIRRKKLSIVRSIFVFLIPYIADYAVGFYAGGVTSLAKNFLSFEIPGFYPVHFILRMLITVLAVALVAKCDFADIADKFILAFFVSRPFHCIACLAYGCCHGAEVEWGIWSGREETTVLPLRAFELILCLGIFVLFHLAYLKGKFKFKGQLCAIGTMAFGVIVLIFDILCTDPAKSLGFISSVGLFSIFNILVGFVMYFYFSQGESERARIKAIKEKGKRA